MMPRLCHIVALFILFSLLLQEREKCYAEAVLGGEVKSKGGLSAGQLLPDFAFADKDDTRYLSKDYVAKGKLLFFYFIKLGNTNITRELGKVDDLADAYPDEMQAFTVFLNAGKAKLIKLSGGRKYGFPLLLGNEKALLGFNLTPNDLPAWVLAGRDGKVLVTGSGGPPPTEAIELFSGLPPQPRIPGKRLPGEKIAYFFARNTEGMEESTLPLIGNGKPLLLFFTDEKVEKEKDDIKAFCALADAMKDVQMRLVVMEPTDDHRKEIAGNKDLNGKDILFGDKVVADLYDTWGRMPIWVLANSNGNVLAVRPNSHVPETAELLALLSGPQFPGEPVPFTISAETVPLDKLYSDYAVAPAFSPDGTVLAWNSHDRFTSTDQLYRLTVVSEEELKNMKKAKEEKESLASKQKMRGLQDTFDSSIINKKKYKKDVSSLGSTEPEAVTEQAGAVPSEPYTGLPLNFSGRIRQLTYSDRDNIAPAWSPTGLELAFHSDRHNFEEIWTMDPNLGGLFDRVTFFRSRAEFPSYTADGQGMVVGADRLGNMDIWVLGPQGRTPYPLVVEDGEQNDPAVSPDGKYVVFTWQTENVSNIWKVRLDGKELTNITENNYNNYMADWSPDGKYVVYVSERSGRPEIWICRADGSGATQLTNEAGDKFFPNWNYDGVHLIYSRRESDRSFSLVLLMLNGWDTATQVVDRVSNAKAAQASQKKQEKKEEGEQRYNPRNANQPIDTSKGIQ